MHSNLLRAIGVFIILNTYQCAFVQVNDKLGLIEEKFMDRLNRIHQKDKNVLQPHTITGPVSNNHETTCTTVSPVNPKLGLNSFNSDIYFQFLLFLDIRSLVSLSMTCKEAYQVILLFSKCRVSLMDPVYVFEELWINLLILAVIYEFKLPNQFKLKDNNALNDQVHLLLFKFLHTSQNVNNQFYHAVITFIYKSVYGVNIPVPLTPKDWRLSLLRHVYGSTPLPLTISTFKSHFQLVPPNFTDNFGDWLDLMELFADNPSRNDLIRLKNTNYSLNHYLHDNLEEDFREIIEELLRV